MTVEQGENSETGATEGEGLPEEQAELKAALQAERKLRREAAAQAKEAQRLLDEATAKNMSEAEQAVAAARKEATATAAASFKAALAAAAVRAAASGKFANPADAVAFVNLAEVAVGDDASVDAAAVTALVDKVLKDRPYLAAGFVAKPGPLGGGGNAAGGGTKDFNALIREMAGRNTVQV